MAAPAVPSKERLLELLMAQCMDYAVVLTLPDGTIVHWLAGASRLFGYCAEEMVGRSVRQLFTPDDVQRGLPVHELQVGKAVGHMEDDRWEVRKDGVNIWVSGVVTALRDDEGRLVGFGKVMRDRTDLKMQTEALENRIRKLLEAEQRNNAFLATVVHELRNPIAPLVNAAGVIRQAGRLEPVAEAALRIIERQAEAMRRLVDDLWDYIRAGAGKMHVEFQELDLKDVLQTCVEELRPRAGERNSTPPPRQRPRSPLRAFAPRRLQRGCNSSANCGT